jgi:hypothetical protein
MAATRKPPPSATKSCAHAADNADLWTGWVLTDGGIWDHPARPSGLVPWILVDASVVWAPIRAAEDPRYT